MGAFKNKTTVAIANDDDRTYFFSTNHCQTFEGDEAFVPTSFYDMSIDEVRDMFFQDFTEIDNPDPDCKP